MKPELKRIETTLDRLAEQSPVIENPTPWENQPDPMGWGSDASSDANRSISMTVESFSDQKQSGKTPVLPKLKAPSFTNHRNAANPALAMTLLQEIEVIVGGWQKELHQILRQIQDIYLEGPIVDGWLESHAREPEVGVEALRQAVHKGHAKSVHQLMDYVEELCNQPDEKVTCESPRAGYRLVGMDENGQFWSRPCPPEQIPSVSVAIARYQKLRLLLNRKEDLETRLSQLAETLVVLHSHLSEN
ncbi:hypothetical protein [Coleofasciculus sp. FACHB-1120]|uniref:hypothetical protein n=1 Tax=Coleofasciculus sp. FACHB-1120 TaxID=2692783 RepID=UPI001688A84F|nr:hypothetical protein [Coleofasciculus sp. FACHB-1120]MBD2744596.1 hypothetical protein [Coleofasciculus sp. FACHB-1120]